MGVEQDFGASVVEVVDGWVREVVDAVPQQVPLFVGEWVWWYQVTVQSTGRLQLKQE